MLYSFESNINQKRCQQCGEEFLISCEKCQKPLNRSFRSTVYFTTTQPTDFPSRPDFCNDCGTPFPWFSKPENDLSDLWKILHPQVVCVSKSRFESGHYADSVEAALKELNSTIKKIYKRKNNEELDGVKLMRKAFSPQNPIIVIDDLATETGRNIQQGYMDLFAGAIAGVRNPKAHDNLEIDPKRAMHHLFLTSLLFYKLDERI